MRTSAAILVATCVTAWVIASTGAAPRAQSGITGPGFNELGLFHDQKAEDLFTQARIAITGGPGGLGRLSGLRMKGRGKIGNPDGSAAFDGDVEIRIQLPDKYLRIDS